MNMMNNPMNMMNNPMNMINPQMNGMSNSAGNIQVNPLMNQMGMNQINPQMAMINSMGPMGMNQMMNQMAMMQMMAMNKQPMTEQQKQEARMKGYLMGKKMAEERRKSQAPANPAPTPAVEEGPATGELTIKFKKNGTTTTIKKDAGEMVADLLNEYFVKTNTKAGKFIFNGKELKPTDINTLAEAGLKNNSEITVS